jgi:hypothetical protein
MGLGDSRQVTATALDEDGIQVPGDPINWSSYVGMPHATITPTGIYTVSATSAGGLDFIAARAGYSYGVVAVQGAFGDGSWFSPGWLRPNISLNPGSSISYMMRVYEGREYTLTTDEDPNVASAGDLDLFVRFNATASNTESDFSSELSGLNEQIVWTAPADGMLSIFLYAFPGIGSPPVAGARFEVSGGIIAPRSKESLAVPGAPRPQVGFAPDHREGTGGSLLPPALDEWTSPPPPAEVRPVPPGRSSGGR